MTLDQPHKMAVLNSAVIVFQKSSEEAFDQSLNHLNKATTVYVRLMFLRIGEIDTLNEKYQAQASIESRWSVELDRILSILNSDEQKRLTQGKSISLIEYAKTHWHPQLFIENSLGDLKEQIRHSAKISKYDNQVYICEHRDIKGLFWEKLELYHFPSDVQDLSISVASMLYDDKVLLCTDPHRSSGVNRKDFVDQQEWTLYEQVDTDSRFVEEFIFRGGEEEEEEEDREDDQGNTVDRKERKSSILTVTCHAARQSNYFFWNGYCLVLLITLVSFCVFAIPPNLAANRIQISCTLLLTSITFRWTVNRSLPTVSYLTSMDKYAIFCLFYLVILALWHAIIGALIFTNMPDNRVTPTTWYVYLDRYVFYGSIGLYAVIHVILIIWLFQVPLKHRRDLKKKDLLYSRQLRSKKSNPLKTKLLKTPGHISIPTRA